MDTFKDQMFVS